MWMSSDTKNHKTPAVARLRLIRLLLPLPDAPDCPNLFVLRDGSTQPDGRTTAPTTLDSFPVGTDVIRSGRVAGSGERADGHRPGAARHALEGPGPPAVPGR